MIIIIIVVIIIIINPNTYFFHWKQRTAVKADEDAL